MLLFNRGSISTAFRYSNSESEARLLLSSTSYTESSVFTIANTATKTAQVISRLPHCDSFGLSSDQIFEIWYQGAEDCKVHAWVVRPSYYQEGEKHPLALFIHGGPPSSWLNAWSTRWNLVVLPDITGSTGYNEEFKNHAIEDYGGRGYHDLELCSAHIKNHIPSADTTLAVALGGSYGGCLINYLVGHPLAKKFKALVSHAGVFNTSTMYASDSPDLYRVLMGGYNSDPSCIPEVLGKWDPARYARNWSTPMLVIHGDRDTRHPVAMGLAAFTTLQLRGVESQFLRFGDEGYFVLGWENSLVWHSAVIGWIDKYCED